MKENKTNESFITGEGQGSIKMRGTQMLVNLLDKKIKREGTQYYFSTTNKQFLYSAYHH